VYSWTQTAAATNTVTFNTTFGTSFSTFTVATNVQLSSGIWTHADNSSAETYRLYVVVGGSVTVLSSATITADYLGYDVNQGPGAGASLKNGGGYGGVGGDNASDGAGGSTYGSITTPTNLGSGGRDGSSGGGSIGLVVGGTVTLHGIMSSGALVANDGAGSGGSIYLSAGGLTGAGTIQANGGPSNVFGGGGGGRVAVKLTNTGSNFSTFTGSLATIGGTASDYGESGAAGTIYKEISSDPAGGGELIIDNDNRLTIGQVCTLMPTSVNLNNFSTITIRDDGNLCIGSDDSINFGTINFAPESRDEAYVTIVNQTGVTFPASFTISTFTLNADGLTSVTSNLTIGTNGRLSHSGNGAIGTYKINFALTGNLTVQSGGEISVDGAGYRGAYGSGAPGYNLRDGGAYGGVGGDKNADGTTAKVYGSPTNPTDLGSGGGFDSFTLSGGGAIILTVSGALSNSGTISADGADIVDGPGSGGSVNLTVGTISGNGAIRAQGGDYAGSDGGGGGGRVAIVLTTGGADFSGYSGSITAYGGDENTYDGAAGTVYLQDANDGTGGGELIIDNASGRTVNTGVTTTLSTGAITVNVGTVTIRNTGQFVISTDSAKLVLKGDWINNGTTGNSQSIIAGTVTFAGSGAQYVRNNGKAFNILISSNVSSGGLNFTSSFTAAGFLVDSASLGSAATVYFAGASTFTISTFTMSGSSSYPVVLKSTNSSVDWRLNNTTSNNVSYTQVNRSSASAGITIQASNSVDLGNNTNWSFSTPTGPRFWVGSGNTNWSTAANWSGTSGGAGGASVPGASNAVVFDANGSGTANLAGAVSIASITVSGFTGTIDMNGFTLSMTNGGTFQSGSMTDGFVAITGPSSATFSGTLFGATVTCTTQGLVISSATFNADATLAKVGPGDVTVNGCIWKQSGADSTLIIKSSNNIVVNNMISAVSNKMHVTLNSDAGANSSGAIQISTDIRTNGGNILLGGGGGSISAGVGYATGTVTYVVGVNINNSTVTAQGGNIVVNGAGYNTSATDNYGVQVTGTNGRLTTSGSGTIQISGKGGGGTANSANNYGVIVQSGGQVLSANGDITINNTQGGGAGSGTSNIGLIVSASNSSIKTTGSGNIVVISTGGNVAGSGSNNYGVYITAKDGVQAAGSGTLSITGVGGNSSGSGAVNVGVYITTSIAGTGTAMTVTGTGGTASGDSNYGIYLTGSGVTLSNVGTGTLTLRGQGGGSTNSATNYGIYFLSGGQATTVNGNLRIVDTVGGGAGGTATAAAAEDWALTFIVVRMGLLLLASGAVGGGRGGGSAKDSLSTKIIEASPSAG
jgi:hypothetical protein